VELDGQTCPKLLDRSVALDHCDFQFYYTGVTTASLGDIQVSVSILFSLLNVVIVFGFMVFGFAMSCSIFSLLVGCFLLVMLFYQWSPFHLSPHFFFSLFSFSFSLFSPPRDRVMLMLTLSIFPPT